jgi:hypothetical protein
MRFRTTLALLVVFAALLFYVLRFEKGKPSAEELEARAKEALTLDYEHVNWFRIETAADTLEARASEGKWYVTRPVNDRADENSVRGLITQLSPLKADRKVEASPSLLVGYQLDRPAVRARFRGHKDRPNLEHSIAVGRKNPTFNGYYTMVDDDTSKVYLVPSYVVESHLQKEPAKYRFQKIAEFAADDVSRAVLVRADSTITLERNAVRDWEITAPEKLPADQAAVNGLVRRLSSQTIETFVEENPTDLATYGLDRAEITFEVSLEDGSTTTLLVGKPADAGESAKYYAKRGSGTNVFTIPKSGRDAFSKSLFDLREKKIPSYKLEDVARVEARMADSTFVAERDTLGEWTALAASGERRPLLKFSVESAVRNLGVMRARRFFDEKAGARIAFDRPEMTVSVGLRDGTAQEIAFVRAGAADDEAFTRLLPAGPIARVSARDFQQFAGLIRHPPFEPAKPDTAAMAASPK